MLKEQTKVCSFFITNANICSRPDRPGRIVNFFTNQKNNLTNLKFYDIIFIENEKRKNLKNFTKSIDNPKIQCYNKEKKKERN